MSPTLLMPEQTAEIIFSKAVKLHQVNNLKEAKTAYERCLALNPDHPHALSNLGSVCRRLGLFPEAMQHLRRAVELLPDDAGVHYNLANALREAGELEAAEASYRRAASLNPQDSMIPYNLGILLTEMKRGADARIAYRQSIIANPAHLEARLNLTESYSTEGEVTAARKELEALLQRKSDFAPALNNLAAILQDTGQIESAVQALRTAAELQPDLPQPRSNLLLGMQYQTEVTSEELLNHASNWDISGTQYRFIRGYSEFRYSGDTIPIYR